MEHGVVGAHCVGVAQASRPVDEATVGDAKNVRHRLEEVIAIVLDGIALVDPFEDLDLNILKAGLLEQHRELAADLRVTLELTLGVHELLEACLDGGVVWCQATIAMVDVNNADRPAGSQHATDLAERCVWVGQVLKEVT